MKKFLSLVLALVMTMSLVTISAGAKDFTDDSKITYKEAVDVISAIKVVDGYADGAFQPTTTLTRGAAAKIICNMILGPTTASALIADAAPFKDVAADHVFAGYIAYCSQNGIINGYADGTFRPAGTLNGYAFMKMLLGALGYDGSIEGYTGANWSINVAKRALNLNLNKGNKAFVGSAAVTREEACLYAFNALNTCMVKYDSKSTISVGDIVISQNSDAKKVIDADGSDHLFREEYFDDLSKQTNNVKDSFGRPAHTWKNDKDKVGTYTDTPDYVVVLDKNYDADDFGTNALISDELQDLTENDDLTVNNDTVLYLNGDSVSTAAAYTAGAAKKGVVLELYADDEDVVETVVAIKTTLAKIDSVEDDLSKTETKAGATVSLDLVTMSDEDVAVGNGTYYDSYKDSDELVLNGYDKETYTKGAVLAVVLKASDDTILSSYVAETEEGKVTSYKASDYAYVGGAKYTFAGNFEGVADDFDFDAEYALYLDENGYVLGIDGITAADLSNVYYVTGVYMTKSTKGTTKYFAETVSLTGEVADFEVEANDAIVDRIQDVDTFYALGELYELTDEKVTVEGTVTCKANNDKFNLTLWTANDDYEVYADGNVAESVKADATKMTVNGSKTYIEKATQFVAIEKDADDLKTTPAVGGMKIAASDHARVIVITKVDDKAAAYVLVVADELKGAITTDEIVYLAEESDEANADGNVATLYFMKDNSSETVTIKAEDNNAGVFSKFSVDDDDVYDLSTADSEIDADVDKDTSGFAYGVTFDNDYIYADALTAGDFFEDVDFSGAKVIDVRGSSDMEADAYDKEITTVAGLKAAVKKGDVTADVYVTDGEITFICVTAM